MTSLLGQMDAERGGSPAATKLHVPGAESVLQALQLSVQALLQQTPSTQKPLAQSASQPHARPLTAGVPASPEQTAVVPLSGVLAEPFEWQPASAASVQSTSRGRRANQPDVVKLLFTGADHTRFASVQPEIS